MCADLIKKELFKQSEIYRMIKNGDSTLVQYEGYDDEECGRRDRNYQKRMCLAYYLLYANIDDEDMIVFLFKEELKDRKTNSFQGIGNTINILTSMLNEYNVDKKYADLLNEAKSANFDCACGYDRNYHINNDINDLDLMDCIYLSQDLGYKDVMTVYVNEWKESIVEWTDENRNTLIRFNSYLDKEYENEKIYKVLLDNSFVSGRSFDIVYAYNNVIKYYINENKYEIAKNYLLKMTATIDFCDIEELRLFGDVLEECFEIICSGVKESHKLWIWAKPYLQKKAKIYGYMYGNLYKKGIAAAKYLNDSYTEQLEEEYLKWKDKVRLK